MNYLKLKSISYEFDSPLTELERLALRACLYLIIDSMLGKIVINEQLALPVWSGKRRWTRKQ